MLPSPQAPAPAPAPPQARTAAIRLGIGGWTYEPWRDNFFPRGLPHAQELAYASARLGMIEINGTYYRLQNPANFAKWRDETPAGFVFSVKASRFTTNRRVLAEAGDSVGKFIASGLAELGPKLGPVVWQFAPTKRFDPVDFQAFLEGLPRQVDGLPLRHAMDVRHDSFRCADYLQLARRFGVATVFTDSDDYPAIADLTSDFVYLRLMRTRADQAEGCAPEVLDHLADCARCWHGGHEPSGLPRIEAPDPKPAATRDVFMLFISGAKEKAPAAAMGVQRRLAGA